MHSKHAWILEPLAMTALLTLGALLSQVVLNGLDAAALVRALAFGLGTAVFLVEDALHPLQHQGWTLTRRFLVALVVLVGGDILCGILYVSLQAPVFIYVGHAIYGWCLALVSKGLGVFSWWPLATKRS